MNFFQNLACLMAVSMLFSLGSCTSEEVHPSVATEHTLDFRGPVPDPEVDCKCYMRVNSIEPALQSQLWGIIDETSPFPSGVPFEIYGMGNQYYPSGVFTYTLDLPSDFRELNPPSNGWHSMIISYGGTVLKINTEVRCYLQNGDGSETLATTTWHQFDLADAIHEGFGVWQFPPRQFSCLVLSEEEGTPRD